MYRLPGPIRMPTLLPHTHLNGRTVAHKSLSPRSDHRRAIALQYIEQFRIVLYIFKMSAPKIQRDCPSMKPPQNQAELLHAGLPTQHAPHRVSCMWHQHHEHAPCWYVSPSDLTQLRVIRYTMKCTLHSCTGASSTRHCQPQLLHTASL